MGKGVVVVDTSALLALVFNEPEAAWVAEQIAAHTPCMSTVNLTEALILIRSRQPKQFDAVEESILSESGVEFIAPDVEQARYAAEARIRFPLNLGDCFAFALALVKNAPVLTLDSDFRKSGVRVLTR